MVLHRFPSSNVTVIPNRFIDEYMISANGEFVKVYLYLLRCSSSDLEISLTSIADVLCHTEKDVKRALTYWEKEHLLSLSYNSDGGITDIAFTDPSQPDVVPQVQKAAQAQKAILDSPDTDHPDETSQTICITSDRKKELSQNEEVSQLLFVAEQYLGRKLSPTDVDHILYFYDDLHLSSDVVEYLIEYCVSKGIKSIHYIKKVAFEWAKQGVKTVQDAKQDSSAYHKEYYTILKSFGIHNRGPAEAEITYMENWINVLGYTMDIILEACSRTITRIHNPSFPYADSILQDWKKKGVHHLSDIIELEKTTIIPNRTASSKGTRNHSDAFGFEPHNIDFQKLEEQLLDY